MSQVARGVLIAEISRKIFHRLESFQKSGQKVTEAGDAA